MDDAAGHSSFNYTSFGAFRSALASEDGPWSGDTVNYYYSGLSLTSVVVGTWSQTIDYDAALRPNVFSSDAGTFTYAFNGAGRELASLVYPGSSNLFDYTPLGKKAMGSHLKRQWGRI
jgi:hypothetical protein